VRRLKIKLELLEQLEYSEQPYWRAERLGRRRQAYATCECKESGRCPTGIRYSVLCSVCHLIGE